MAAAWALVAGLGLLVFEASLVAALLRPFALIVAAALLLAAGVAKVVQIGVRSANQ